VASLPVISIVTPSYQYGRFIEWTIRSVLLQRYPKLEYVVMDGGSTDQTPAILDRYRPFLTHVESGPDGGQADAVVRGFAHTTGEIMAYLNSDDMLAPGALEFVAGYFSANPEVDAIYSHRVFVGGDNTVESYWILPEHNNWLMSRWDYIPQETCFWRRRIYDQAGGIHSKLQFALDYDLFVRFMKRGRMRRVNRFLGAFRTHPSSKTSGLIEGHVHPEVQAVRRDYGLWFPPLSWLIAHRLLKRLESASQEFAASGKVLPGALAGVGYNYDRVWAGLLNQPMEQIVTALETARSGT
jgi:glycosyltransferase involved in cell wall biosynthesis